jgi:eukaryotic-like serine/threonine-protein kinase
MATGQRPYTGASRPAVISAIMASDPPAVSSLRPDAPGALDVLVKTCLAKDPAARWDSAHDLELRLREMGGEGAAEPGKGAAAPRRGAMGPWLVATLAIAIAIATAGTTIVRTARSPGPSPAFVRFVELPPAQGRFSFWFEAPRLAVSPDGSKIAYIAVDSSGARRVWVRALDALPARALEGTEKATSIFWSPDGRSIGLITSGVLQRVDLAGGAPVPICPIQPDAGYSATWGREGEILFSRVLDHAIHRVSAAGGTPTIVVKADPSRGEESLRWPWYLPDGVQYLYVVRHVTGSDDLMIGGAGQAPRVVMAVESNVEYSDPGLLTFVREGTLLAQPFDWRTGRVSGSPFAVADRVRYFLSTGMAGYSTSSSGTLVYQQAGDQDRMVWLDRTGKEMGTLGPRADYLSVLLSPDGGRVLCSRAQPAIGTYDVWSYDLERGVETAITSGRTTDLAGPWLPGMRRIAHSQVRGGAPHLLIRDLDTGKDAEIVPSSGFQLAQDVSPDGQTLLYTERNERGVFDIWTVALNGKGGPSPFLQSAFDKEIAVFSPDGRYIAFRSAELGQADLYIAPYPGPGERVRVTTDGATALRWSRSGGEILYLSGQHTLRSVPVRTTPQLRVGVPVTLFALEGTHDWKGFDVSPDGQRILAIIPEVVADELPLHVLVHWPAARQK